MGRIGWCGRTMVALDIVWLRICLVVTFLFGGLFLKRVLSVGAFCTAIGLPAALVRRDSGRLQRLARLLPPSAVSGRRANGSASILVAP
jgi:hypothetical protein